LTLLPRDLEGVVASYLVPPAAFARAMVELHDAVDDCELVLEGCCTTGCARCDHESADRCDIMRTDLPVWVYERFDARGPDVRDYSGRGPYAWDRLGARLSHRALDYPWSALRLRETTAMTRICDHVDLPVASCVAMRQLCDVAAHVRQDVEFNHRSRRVADPHFEALLKDAEAVFRPPPISDEQPRNLERLTRLWALWVE